MNKDSSGKCQFRMGALKCAGGASICLLLAGLSEAMASNGLTGQDILKATQKAYDALTSYSDKSTAEDNRIGEHSEVTYTTRLLRPNLYKIEWTVSRPSGPVNGVLCSDGTASVLTMGAANPTDAMPPMRADFQSCLGALIFGTGVPLATDLPGIFLSQKNTLTYFLAPGRGVKATISREADEKIDQTDCFVISLVTVTDVKGSQGKTWKMRDTSRVSIGKQDFLIRRWRVADDTPGMLSGTSTITHDAISVNPHLSPEDFAH